MEEYDAGLLGDGGGGDVAWWHNYIQVLLCQARNHYIAQNPITDRTLQRLDDAGTDLRLALYRVDGVLAQLRKDKTP